jgi:hypothetical protein
VVSSGNKTEKKPVPVDLSHKGKKLVMDAAPTPKVQTPKQDFKKPEVRSTRATQQLFEAGKTLGKEIV